MLTWMYSYEGYMASEKKIFEFFFFFFFIENLAFRLSWPPIKIGDLDKIHMLVEDFSSNISVKLLSKYLQ